MAKQLNVDLRFSADTTQAKQQLQDLQASLNKLTSSTKQNLTGLGITKEIAQATTEVAKLQAMLESSKNASGGLDLGKFNQSLAQGQVKISDYAKTLSSLGPQGDQAFAQLAKAVVNADVPLKRTNGLLNELKISLMNTARWQLSSSVLHGFMGAIQSAYGYAQDLNESLNNIRIVTGQSTDQMANFAKQANKAAQALNTTTTEYTDASLIYYQQGLSDSEVAARTEVTIKMANAAGQSAQTVSDQLTAIWNNFYDGSKSLEYYADVMTALGAATASSTDEIAGGLEKFAAIGNTIGLSYEYAASALATITSNTRQSEEVVGTALKTIFARIQGLNLGETLDDGTSLNKYSEALQKVGISIFEQNGEIKKMDNILDEMAAKWGTLAKDQQIALAQTVAGVRQYTQLIALMDNWNAGDSDSMMANLDTAYNATGTLQEQADIYAESWEAARDRVTAAAEEIYNQLLNDKFFIALNNGFAGFLNILSNTIDSLGGLPGVLTLASSLMFKMFGKDIAQAIDNWGYNIKLRSKEGLQSILQLRQEAVKALKETYANNIDTGPINSATQTSFESQANIADTLLIKKQELLAKGQALSEQDQRQAQLLLQINEAYGEQAIESAKVLENTQKQSDSLERQIKTQARRYNNKKENKTNQIDLKELETIKQSQIQYSTLAATFDKLSRAKKNFSTGSDVKKALEEMSNAARDAGMDVTAFERVLAKISSGMSCEEALNAIETEMYEIGDAAYNAIEDGEGLRQKLLQIGMSDEQINKLIASWEKQGIITSEVAENLRNVKIQGDEAVGAINKMTGPPPTVGQQFMAVANVISNVAMSINAIKGLIDTWNNDDMSFGEKLISTFTTLGMVIPMVASAFSANNMAMLGSVAPSIAAAFGFKKVGIEAAIATGGVSALWATLWPIALAVGAVSLAVAGLTAIFKGLSNAYNKDAIAAENAATAAKNLGDAYNECKQEYQNMISAMENYQSAQDALENLTNGTKEYRDALKEANRQALELINQYDLIEGQDYRWENDKLVIEDEALNRKKAEKENEIDTTYAASQMASAKAKRARAIADQTKLRREIRDDAGFGDGDNMLAGAMNGITAGLGVMLAGVTGGASLLATVGALANQDVRAKKAQAYDEAINKAVKEGMINQQLWTDKATMASALKLDDQDLIDALWANRESIQELSNNMNMAAEAEKVAAQNAANEIMSESRYDRTEAGRMAMEAGGEIYQQIYGDVYDSYLADAKDRTWYNAGTGASKAVFDEYAKQTGLNELKNFKVTNYKGDGTVEYKYIDDNGQEQTKIATAEEIAATLAAADAASQLEGALSNLRNTIANLNNSKDLRDHAMAEFLSTGNMEGATKAEFDDIRTDAGVTGERDTDDNLIYDAAAVDSMLGLTGDAAADLELAKSRGYESAEAYRNAFIESLDVEWEIPEKIAPDMAGVLSIGAAGKIQSTYEQLGAEGGQAFVDTLNHVTSGADFKGLDLEEQTAMMDEMANIDWTSWDAGEQAIAIAERYGVAIDATSGAWQNNINVMRDASNVLPNLEAMRNEFEKIQEITSDIELGSILSEEDYKALVRYNSELSKYFTILSDGSAQFIGDKLDFQQQINEAHQQDLQEAMQQYQDRYAEIQKQLQDGSDSVGGIENLDGFRDTENYVGDDGNNHYKGTNVNKQLDFLESQGYDQEKLEEWRTDLSDGNTTVQVLEDIASAVNTTADAYNSLGVEAETMQGLIQGTMNEIALSAESAEERMAMLKEGTINLEAYGYAAMAAHNAEKWEDLDPKEVEEYADSIMEAADSSALLSDELKNNEEAAEDVALYTKKMNKGIDALSDGFKDWSDVLKKSDKSSEEYAVAMEDMKEAMSDVLGVGEEWLSNDFILNNLEDIEKAANGDAEAIDRLAIAAGKDILVNMELADEGVRDELYALHDQLAAEIPKIEVGATIDSGDFLAQAAQIVESAGMTVEQANAYFRSMGFEPNFETKQVPVESKQPIVETLTEDAGTENVTYEQVNPDGTTSTVSVPMVRTRQTSRTVGYTTSQEMMEVPALTTDGGKPNFTLTRTNAGGMNNSSGSNKGGGGKGSGGGGSKGKPTTGSKGKKTDIVDRYKEINDQLEETNRLLKKNEVEADSLWGPKRIAVLKNSVKLLEQENKQLEEKYDLSKQYLKEDADALARAATEAGIAFTIDDATGNILNYTDAMTQLFNEREKLLDSFGSTMSESEEKKLQALDDKIEKVKDAYEQYETTLDEKRDLEQEQMEKLAEIQQQYYDILSEELELKISINDDDLKVLDYYFGKIEDDFYDRAEAAALMIDSSNSLGISQKDVYEKNLAEYDNYLVKLNEDYKNGKISQSDYINGLRETQDSIISNLQSLNDLDDAMMEYYGDTLDMAIEEIAKYTDQMDHLVGVLDHYQSLMTIMGKENNYAAMGIVLEGRAKLLEDQVAVSKSTMEMLKGEADDRHQAYLDALAAGDEAAAEMYLKQYEDALAAANEAEDKFLSQAEEWAESLKAILENKLKGLNKTLEEALTGGTSFDSLNTAMERAKSLQEEYLTTTNKIYETNKLMRKAQQEIDKTTNSVAKKRLQEFIAETDQLQDKAKLSKFELDIQQAKYDLLLAEIALQEAQNAKSTVRLQRDSEGNFGYVYTADENLVAEAEQTLLDKQNALYNLSLDGANDYKEKYLQTLNEMYDTLADLQQQKMDGMFASEEEYQQAVAEATQFYYEQLEQYADLHGIAIATDGRVINEAWSADFADMVQDTAVWKVAVDGYLDGAKKAFDQWAIDIGKVAKAVGIPLDEIENGVSDVTESFSDLGEAVGDVTDESTQLKDALLGEDGVIETVQSEIDAVKTVTEKYANLREELEKVKKSYEDIILAINNAIKAQAQLSSNTSGSSSSANGGSSSGTTSSGSSGNNGNSGSGGNPGNSNPNKSGGSGYDNEGYNTSTVKTAQNFIGVTPDGKWGPNSRKVAKSKGYNSLKAVVDAMYSSSGTSAVRTTKPGSGSPGDNKGFIRYEAYDTGGYTGQWGPSGKWAMLHEKELVLNKKDTENFLASMDILDKIVSVIDLHSTNAQLGGLLSSPYYSGFKDNQILEQNVRIEASFPNATNHSEIEEAFNNLINTASQYANRK